MRAALGTSAARLERLEFNAMGTTCAVAVSADPADFETSQLALAAGRNEVSACERALSRFAPDSDLSRLNRSAGAWVSVDSRLVEALGQALSARGETEGRFDPTILPVLAAAGYDRSFEQLEHRAARAVPGWSPGWRIDLDPQRGRARLQPDGAGVDLGGIGKGFAADRAIAAMREASPGLSGCLVDLGGDIALWGAPPEGGPWRLAVADPFRNGGLLGTIRLRAGGVATSGRDQRRFGPNRRLHHLIDPALAAPAQAGTLAMTVLAADATRADAHATALALLERRGLPAYLGRRPELAALVVADDGAQLVFGALGFTPRPREEAAT